MEKELLLEVSRSQITRDARKPSATYRDTSKGKNRFERRVRSKFSNSVQEYNKIDMNSLFKDDILNVKIKVTGETNTYTVKISFIGFLEELHKEVRNNGEFNLRSVLRALKRAFDGEDVKIYCTCPDFKYRYGYYANKKDMLSADKRELNRTTTFNDDGTKTINYLMLSKAPDITNPKDDKGYGCKHIMLVLNNNSWLQKVASVINNYVNYMEKHQQRLYADIIYPAIYENEYNKDVQLDLFDNGKQRLKTDKRTISSTNKWAATKNQFKKGNDQGIRFASSNVPKQMSFDDLISDAEPTTQDEED